MSNSAQINSFEQFFSIKLNFHRLIINVGGKQLFIFITKGPNYAEIIVFLRSDRSFLPLAEKLSSMATTKKPETLPTKESVLKKDPMPVVEVPAKKVVLVNQKSSEEKTTPVEENQQKQSTEMEVDGVTEDVIGPSNQT